MLIAVLATATGVTFWSKWSADRAAYNATRERLSTTGNLCVNAPFPLTANVLTQIQELSNLRLAILSQVALNSIQIESKSADFPSDISLILLRDICLQANSSGRNVFIKSIVSDSAICWNATALTLASNPLDRSSTRFIVLLELAESANRNSVQAFVFPLLTGLCSAIAVAVAATWVANRIVNRLERLEKHVQRIASGSFEWIEPQGPLDSIHALYESVNSMSQQLKLSTSQVAKNERTRLVNLIASGLAHELRNYLTGAKLAIQTCQPDLKTHEALSIAQKQMQLAEESIQRLLTLRIDNVNKPSQSMRMTDIMNSVAELMQPIATHKRVGLFIESLETLHDRESELTQFQIMISDGSAIIGSLINLILNAIEAAGPGGIVEMRHGVITKNEDRYYEWVCRDNGPGPLEEIKDNMFEPFATTKREGVGLGLATCRQTALRQYGDVTWYRKNSWTIFTMVVRPERIE